MGWRVAGAAGKDSSCAASGVTVRQTELLRRGGRGGCCASDGERAKLLWLLRGGRGCGCDAATTVRGSRRGSCAADGAAARRGRTGLLQRTGLCGAADGASALRTVALMIPRGYSTLMLWFQVDLTCNQVTTRFKASRRRERRQKMSCCRESWHEIKMASSLLFYYAWRDVV